MATGDVGAVIETVEVDTLMANPRMLHIAGDVYAIVYRGPDQDGFIKTYSIDASGDISAAAISSLEFDTDRADMPTICHVSGDVYAIAYEDSGGDGRLKTLHISDAGIINPAIIDNQLFSPINGSMSHMIHVSGSIFLIVYIYSGNAVWVRTVNIDSEGNIANTNVGDLEVDTTASMWPRIAHVTGDIYAICYYYLSNQGMLRTISCDSEGGIGASPISSVQFDAVLAYKPQSIKTTLGKYTIVYQGPDSDGFLKTWAISGEGEITDPPIEIYEFDVTSGVQPVIASIGGEWYAIAYQNDAAHGNIRTVEIKNDGDIITPYHAEGEYYNYTSSSKDAVQINDTVFAIVQEGFESHGKLTTISLEGIAAPERRASSMMMMGLH